MQFVLTLQRITVTLEKVQRKTRNDKGYEVAALYAERDLMIVTDCYRIVTERDLPVEIFNLEHRMLTKKCECTQ